MYFFIFSSAIHKFTYGDWPLEKKVFGWSRSHLPLLWQIDYLLKHLWAVQRKWNADQLTEISNLHQMSRPFVEEICYCYCTLIHIHIQSPTVKTFKILDFKVLEHPYSLFCLFRLTYFESLNPQQAHWIRDTRSCNVVKY